MSQPTRVFTPQGAEPFRRQRSKKIYLAVDGWVYDVTKGKTHYAPGRPYNVFAGKPCGRALALLSLEEEDISDDVTGLDEAALTALEEWKEEFKSQYPVAGKIGEKKRFRRRALPVLAIGAAIAGVLLRK